MNQHYQTIEQTVESVRRRRRALQLARDWLIALACAAAILLVALLILPSLGGGTRLAFRLTAGIALFAALGSGVVLTALRRESLDRAALEIEGVNPDLKNALISSLQLQRASSQDGAAGAFSRELFSRHLENTARKLPELSLPPAAPLSRLKRPAIGFGLVAVFFLLALALLPGRIKQGAAALVSDPLRPPAPPRELVTAPLTTGDFTLHYTFPAYSRIPPQTIANTRGELAALKGTVVKIETSVLEPVRSASLITTSGARYEMKVEDRHRLEAELILSEPGKYHLEAVGEDGELLVEASSHRIIVDEDLPPRVVMLEPISDLEVAAEGSVRIVYEADDDFGVRDLTLVFQRAGAEHEVLIQGFRKESRTKVNGEFEWNLSEHKFQPGERIPFFLTVTDNDEVTPGKIGRSEIRVLEIYSARKNHRALLARLDDLLNRMIDHLASHLVSWLAASEAPERMLADERGLTAEGRELVKVMSALLADLENDEYADRLVILALENMIGRYPARLDEREGFAVSEPAPRPKLKSAVERYRADLENDILYLDKLIKKERIQDLLAEADDLYKAQAELSDLVAEYRRTGDPALLDQLRQALAELESAFENLGRLMAEMRKSMPEEFVNVDALNQAGMGGLADQMEKLRQALADGDMETAMELAENFLSRMGDWMTALESGANAFGDMISAETMAKLDSLKELIQDAIARQQFIEDSLQELYRQGLERGQFDLEALQSLDRKIQQEIREIEQSVLRAQQALFRMRPTDPGDGKPLPRQTEFNRERNQFAQPLTRLRQEAREVLDLLKRGEFEGALEQARELENKINDSSRDCQGFARENNAGPPEQLAEHEQNWERAGAASHELVKALEALKRASESALTAEEKQQLEWLKAMELGLQDDVNRMREQYEEMMGEAPSLPEQVSASMGKCSGKAGEAAEKMGQGQPAPALLPAREARGHLEQALNSLNQAQQQMAQSMMMGPGMMGMGGMTSRAREQGDHGMSDPEAEVAIPDEDKYKVPEEFREEILRAMRGKAPETYKHLNRDYYERLIK